MKKPKHNKYPQNARAELDLHGHTKSEATEMVQKFLDESNEKGYTKVRIITGKGLHSTDGPILKRHVEQLLTSSGYRFNTSKINEGGKGAIEVTLQQNR